MTDALLREVLMELSELRELVAGRRLSSSERTLLASALPIVHRVTREAPFAAGDLIDYARASTPDALALRAALAGRSARQVGKLLARARGGTIGGYRIRREGDECGSVLWVCLANKPFDLRG